MAYLRKLIIPFVLFLLFVLPFAVVHDAADGGLFHGGDFDEVEAGFACEAQRLHGGNDPNLFIQIIDQTDGRNADLFVATQTVLANGGSS